MDLADEQWVVIESLTPEQERQTNGIVVTIAPVRDVMNGILWILRTGACWHDFPDRYASYQMYHRRLQQWVDSGVFDHMLQAIATNLHARGGLDLSECFIDGTFVVAKKRAQTWEQPRGEGYEDHGNANRAGLPIALHIASAALHPMKSPL